MKKLLLIFQITLIFISCSKKENYQKTDNGLRTKTNKGYLSVTFVKPEIARIRFSLTNNFSDSLSLMRVPLKTDIKELNYTENDSFLAIHSEKLEVRVDKKTFTVSYHNPETKELIFTENTSSPRSLDSTVVTMQKPDPASYKTVQTIDGERQIAEKFITDSITSFKGQLNFKWQENEALYGLGSHEEDYMNLRGTSQYLYQHNMKMVIPFLNSTKGYGLLFDAYCHMKFQDDAKGSFMQFDAVNELDYYFVYGKTMKNTISGYRELTGEASMLPKYTFGYTQSKERYKDQKEIVATVAEFRKRNIPLDLIVQDWRYWPKNAWSGFIWDEERYPNPTKMSQDIHDMNAHLMISIWPNIGGGPNHKKLKESGYTLAGGNIVDAFKAEGREFYWELTNTNLFSKGIDAFWTDSSEPTIADWKGVTRQTDFNEANMARQNQVVGTLRANAYGLMHAKGIYENQRKTTSDKRVYSLTRSAYAGSQRYAAVSWTGDVSAKWSVFRQQIPSGLNFVASGNPYWTNDAGAFFVRNRVEDPRWFWDGDYQTGVDDYGFRELYTRWLQYSTFLPVMRSHGTDTPREPWQFGKKGEPFYDAIINTIDLRYQLLPYIYSVAANVHFNNDSMMYPLAFDFPNDEKVYDLKDQFMFGNNLMVCPVTQPMYFEANSKKLNNSSKTRKVYLPKDASWYNFYTNKLAQGGNEINAEATISNIPIFVKAGSILPFGEKKQYTSENPGAPIEIKIYPGADAEFTYYEDEGNNYNFENGAFATTKFSWDDTSKKLKIFEREGNFEGMLTERNFILKLINSDSEPKNTIYNGQSQEITF